MTCPQCGYIMTALDKDCPRCHGFGLGPAPTPAPNAAPPTPTPATKSIDPPGFNGSALKRAGRGLIAGGVVGLFYFMLLFDTSVEVPGFGGRVNNIGLMADRQNYMMLSMGAIILGSILLGLEYLKSKD